MELEDERFPRGGGRCDDDVLAGSGQVECPALVVPHGVEGVDAGGAGGDQMGRNRDGALGLGGELVAVDGGARDALGFGLRIGI